MSIERFEPFLIANEKRIYHYLIQILGNESDAQDLVQVVFLAFYEHIDSIEEATAVSYLYRIAHNKSLSYIKVRNKTVLVDPGDFNRFPDNSKPAAEPDYTFLKSAISELPHRLSTVIHLQYYEKLSYKEIAAQLGISVKAVETLLVRAKKILRKKIMKDKDLLGV